MIIKLNTEKERYIETVDHIEAGICGTVTKGRSKNPTYYLRQPCFLDTETSWNHDEDNPIGWVYQWCFEFNGQYCIGRKVSELIKEFRSLHDHYELNEKRRLVCYIHNASYDITYLYKQLRDEFGEPKILAIKAHKILTALFDGIEFRCTWLLSNMSLDSWGEKLGCKVRKLVGAIDYELVRYQDDELSYIDWEYMVNDVASLKCCVYTEMLQAGDTVATIPLTSTGYVRRDCRREAWKEDGFRKWFASTKMTHLEFLPALYSYAGGLTHGNRYLAGKTLDYEKLKYLIGHIDFKSFYPAEDELEYMPMSALTCYYLRSESPEPLPENELVEQLNTKCCIMLVSFKDLRLKKGVTCPCISKHKIANYWECTCTINDEGVIGTDNGRVINCLGSPALYCTELDYYWILDQYETGGVDVLELYTAERGRDRDAILKVTNEYFKGKETLPKDNYFYHKQKNKLNAIYGMKSTNPVRETVTLDLDSGLWDEKRDLSPENVDEVLRRYYSSHNSFNFFLHGVFITSWSRSRLLQVIRDVVGYENFCYADTDSVFYVKKPEIEERLRAFNNMRIEQNKKYGLGVVNRNGDMSYYGVLESEKDLKKFRFLHAKCYAYVDMDDKLSCTIAGVTADNKKLPTDADYMTREQELGSIDNLKDGMTFKECGGTNSLYVDRNPETMYIAGHITEVASACIIRKTTKQLGGTVEGFNIYEIEN